MKNNESIIARYSETGQHISLCLKKPSTRYLDQFIRMTCAPDLLALQLFPNAKEITESMAGYVAVRKQMREHLHNPAVHCFVIGDGCTPRTAALVAHLTKWQVHSIDPALRKDKIPMWESKVRRLKCSNIKVQDYKEPWLDPNVPHVILAVHSHAPLEPLWTELVFKGFRVMTVAIPCCVEQSIGGRQPSLEYVDWGIWSPKRTVKLWFRYRRKEVKKVTFQKEEVTWESQ